MKTIPLLALAAIITANAYTQTLPKVQQKSLRAPANTKVDGKATEWGDKFEAYNPGSRVFYTMANDDANLYLYLKTEEATATSKILRGGVQFTVNAAVKKRRL